MFSGADIGAALQQVSWQSRRQIRQAWLRIQLAATKRACKASGSGTPARRTI
jgi:hypothetical protein